MQLTLYNTARKKQETVTQPTDRPLGIYSCGITAYDYAHIGNLRHYVMDDLLIRTLKYDGYKLKHVQNVTDVGHLTSDSDTGEDKLEKGARRDGDSVTAIARKFEKYFYDRCDDLNIIRPDVITRATEYIEEQLKIAIELEKKGFAYLIPGDGLYFDTSRVADYGALAGFNPQALQEGARVEKVAGRRQPTDFAVWKLEKPGENRQMVWPSPWGERSFPGWHLECVAMSLDQLGDPVDIHTGGVDHIPVHHTNEIAQAEAYTGRKPFVKIWVHGNFMRIDGQKMSKSLGNIYRLEDILQHGYTPMQLRYLFLTSHYRHELNFTWESLAAAAKAYDRLLTNLAQYSASPDDASVTQERIERIQAYTQQFLQLVNDDLNVPEALALVNQILKSNLTPRERYDLIIEFDEILGLDLRRQSELKKHETQLEVVLDDDGEAQRLLEQRQDARAQKDYARADYLRDRIAALGYNIIDTPDGPKVEKKS